MVVSSGGRLPSGPVASPLIPVAGVSWTSPAVQDLLWRARRELAAAEAAGEPAERFRHAHLAALRAASAVVEVRSAGRVRRRPQPVWDLLAAAAPELSAWAAYFRGGSAVRAAIEAGREPALEPGQADHLLSMAGLFLDELDGGPLARAS